MSNRPDTLTVQQRLILDHLRHTRGIPCSMSRLVAALYGSCPNGGPDDPQRTIRVQLCKIRRWLRQHDVRLLTIGRTAGVLGYMIDPDDAGRLEAALETLTRLDIALARGRVVSLTNGGT